MLTRLSDADIELALQELTSSGWERVEDRSAITKCFHFSDFNQAWGFMCRCALIAEQLNHHPEWYNDYNRVEVTLSTHDVGGLSVLDFRLAKAMDKCLS